MSRMALRRVLPAAMTALMVCAPAAAGTLLVLNKSADTLAFVDPDKLEVIATAPTGRAPHEVAVDAAGAMAWVSNYGTADQPGNTLSLIDIAARKTIGTVDLGAHKRPHGIVVAPDGMIWVTCEGSQDLVVVDPAQRKVARSYTTGQVTTHMVTLAAGGKKAFTANIGSDTVTMVDAASGAVAQIAVGKGPEGMDLSPDGAELWVAHRGDGGLSIIDPAGGKVIHRIAKVGDMPIRVKFTPDGARVLISCADGNELAVFDARGRKEIARIKTGAMPVGILVLPGGRRAFVANTMADKVSLVDLEKAAVVGSVAPGREPDGMAWVETSAR